MKIMGVDVKKAIVSAIIFFAVFLTLSTAIKLLFGDKDLM